MILIIITRQVWTLLAVPWIQVECKILLNPQKLRIISLKIWKIFILIIILVTIGTQIVFMKRHLIKSTLRLILIKWIPVSSIFWLKINFIMIYKNLLIPLNNKESYNKNTKYSNSKMRKLKNKKNNWKIWIKERYKKEKMQVLIRL